MYAKRNGLYQKENLVWEYKTRQIGKCPCDVHENLKKKEDNNDLPKVACDV